MNIMENNNIMQSEINDLWATVELMGHGQTAGRISKPTEWGGLLRVDVPTEDGFRTEFYGMAAIYAVKFVSEEIARAFVSPQRGIVSYDTPIVTREQHNAALRQIGAKVSELETKNWELERRLVAIRSLPLPPLESEEPPDRDLQLDDEDYWEDGGEDYP